MLAIFWTCTVSRPLSSRVTFCSGASLRRRDSATRPHLARKPKERLFARLVGDVEVLWMGAELIVGRLGRRTLKR